MVATAVLLFGCLLFFGSELFSAAAAAIDNSTTLSETLVTRCPMDCHHGDCVEEPTARCECYESSIKGHWATTPGDGSGACDVCLAGYYGPRCLGSCPGAGSGNITCSGHGTCDDGRQGNGQCLCHEDAESGFWSGPDCSLCAQSYIGAACKQKCDCSRYGTCRTTNSSHAECVCEYGFFGRTCDWCDPTIVPGCVASNSTCPSELKECSGHGTCTDGRCVCLSSHAHGMWSGVACDVCADGFAGPTCGVECASAHGHLCGGHGTCNSGTLGDGTCLCVANERAGFWTGPACDQCALSYFGANCTMKCQCSPHATCYLTQNGTECICERGWSGPACDVCDPQLACNSSMCPGNARPTCPPLQSSSHSCPCECTHQWTGAQCDVCPTKYDAAGNCSSCAVGFTGYPSCSPVCTVANDCSGRAVSVNVTETGCACQCINQWYGARCELCPAKYDPARNCGSCAAGLSGYPSCFRSCTVANDCSGRAVSVNATVNGCECECRNQWYGARCDVCPTKYDPKGDCAACAAGHSGYPTCTQSNGGAAPDAPHSDPFFSTPLGTAAAVAIVVACGAVVVAAVVLIVVKVKGKRGRAPATYPAAGSIQQGVDETRYHEFTSTV